MLDAFLVNHIPLDTVSSALKYKFQMYAWVFNRMEVNQGRFPYPIWFVSYLENLGVEHWAEYYFKENLAPFINEAKSNENFLTSQIYDDYGASPTNKEILRSIRDISEAIANGTMLFEDLEFLERDPDLDELNNLSQEEKDQRKQLFMFFLVIFLNDLSIATHGESIFILVRRAIDEDDIDAFAKAIQIDPTIRQFFNKKVTSKFFLGDSNFFDIYAYRIKNPTQRGLNKHPLLWILFRDLSVFGCLRKGITNKQVLDLYNSSMSEFPQFLIDDEQTVQRQRRKFIKKYRLLK